MNTDDQASEPSLLERLREKIREVPASKTDKSSRRQAERPLTVQEAADELGLSVYTVRAWVAERRLSHLRLGRAIRIPVAEIRRVLEESTIPAAPER